MAGFNWQALDGYEDGFPVLIENGLSAKRSAELLQYLLDGNYLDHKVGWNLNVPHKARKLNLSLKCAQALSQPQHSARCLCSLPANMVAAH